MFRKLLLAVALCCAWTTAFAAQYQLTNTAWVKIASAGSSVEIQNLSTGGTKITVSATAPAANADYEVLYDYTSLRQYSAPLPNDLYAIALNATSLVQVMAIGSTGGGGGSSTLPPNAAQETGGNLASIATKTPALGQAAKAGSSPVTIASDQGPIATADPSNAAFQGVVAMTVGTTYAAQRSIGIVCTAPGNVSVTFADGSTLVVPVNVVGFQSFPFAVTAVNSSGTTATATYYNMK